MNIAAARLIHMEPMKNPLPQGKGVEFAVMAGDQQPG